MALDFRTTFFFVTTSAVLGLSIVSLIPLIGRKVQFLAFKGALLAAAATFSFRPIYSTNRPTSWNMEGLQLWAAAIGSSNNFQYTLYSFLFLQGQPVTLALAPLCISCAYQWMTIASKQLAHIGLWQKYGVWAFQKMEANMAHAIAYSATLEISALVFLFVELFTPARSPVRFMLYLNLLRMRYACTDSTVLRLKYTHGHTQFYHQQVWGLIEDKLGFILRFPALQPALTFVKNWFTGRR